MTPRITKLNTVIEKKNLDAFLITTPENVYYMSGFKPGEAYLLITKIDNFLITDFRYKEDAQEVPNFKMRLIDGGFPDSFKKILKHLGIKKVGFEADNLSYHKTASLRKTLKDEKIKLEPLAETIEELRLLKDDGEIKKIKNAIAIARKVLGALKIRPGITEKEVSQDLDNLIRVSGGDRNAFPTIVASGVNSSRPHAAVTNKVIKKDELVLVDFGVNLDMYNCDLTRVFQMGKIERLLYDVYLICKEAQRLAIEKVKPGVRAKAVDKVARDYIAGKGFGKSFGHSLGHGVGIAIHELPRISYKSDCVLKPNMVFTVEPGIYIEKLGGVRIEDMVLVTQNGCEVLTDDLPQ